MRMKYGMLDTINFDGIHFKQISTITEKTST